MFHWNKPPHLFGFQHNYKNFEEMSKSELATFKARLTILEVVFFIKLSTWMMHQQGHRFIIYTLYFHTTRAKTLIYII